MKFKAAKYRTRGTSLDQQSYRRLISGQQKNWLALVLRLLLLPVSWFYGFIVCLRNFLYDKQWLKAYRIDPSGRPVSGPASRTVPVISVGNLTVGGTGKTPLVIWLCNQITQNSPQDARRKASCGLWQKFKTKNCGCAILTRGYRATQNYTDEPAILAKACPHAKVVVNPDRVAAAAEAVTGFAAKVLVADDAFQHRRLARDLDILTIDATCPFGYDKMLPAGLLREPLAALARAHAVVITRCDQVEHPVVSKLVQKLKAVNPNLTIATSVHSPVHVESTDNCKIEIPQLTRKRVFAFCGIGNPDAFLATVKKLGLDCPDYMTFNDHHRYTRQCLNNIYRKAENCGANLLLTTEKDFTKLAGLLDKQTSEPPLPLAYLAVELKFLTGLEQLKLLIDRTIEGKIPASSVL